MVTHSGYSFVKKIGEVRKRTNNPWYGGNGNQNFAYALPDSFAPVEKFYVQGFSGFYVDVDQNVRVNMGNDKIENNVYSVNFLTWAGSKTISMTGYAVRDFILIKLGFCGHY